MDRIQQKILLWQQQITPLITLKEKIHKSPLVILAVFLAIGILTQNKLNIPLYAWFSILTLSGISAITLKFYKPGHSFIFITMALLSFASLGGIRMLDHKTLPPNDISNIIKQPDTIAALKGTILNKPRIMHQPDWLFKNYKFYDPSTTFYLSVDSILSNNEFKPSCGTVKVYVSQPTLNISAGDKIELLCKLNTFNSASNPGQFDSKKYMNNNNVYLAASARSSSNIKILDKNSGILQTSKTLIQSFTSANLLDNINDQQNQSLLNALLLGNRAGISRKTTQAFRQTGLLHFISLSGLHVGILLGFVWFTINPVVQSKSLKAAICLIIICIFLLAVPPRAPTVRACIIAAFFCISVFFKKHPSPFNSLSLGFIVLLMIKPTDIFSPGFQLSFACVTGILLFSKPIYRYLLAIIKSNNKIILWSIGLLSTGIAAWIGGAGILIFHFNSINLLAPLWTVIAFPFIAAILCLGTLKIIISAILPTVAIALAYPITFIVNITISIVHMLANTLSGQFITGSINPTWTLLYYLMIILFAFRFLIRPNFRKLLFFLTTLTLTVGITINVYQNKKPQDLILSVMDVAAGQSIILQSNGKNYIFDAGSLNISNCGDKIINPFLNHVGITNFQSGFISHDDIDHFNGLPEIIKNNDIERIFLNISLVEKQPASKPSKRLLNFLEKNSVDVEITRSGRLEIENLDIKLLWPIKYDPLLSDNCLSNVYLLEHANRKILLCSDIEKDIQNKIIALYPDLKADIMILPHHGSSSTISEKFINHINPSIAVSSCSKRYLKKVYMFPNANNYNTAQHGCVTIKIDKNSNIEVITFIKP